MSTAPDDRVDGPAAQEPWDRRAPGEGLDGPAPQDSFEEPAPREAVDGPVPLGRFVGLSRRRVRNTIAVAVLGVVALALPPQASAAQVGAPDPGRPTLVADALADTGLAPFDDSGLGASGLLPQDAAAQTVAGSAAYGPFALSAAAAPAVVATGATGIPAVVLAAYQRAAESNAALRPGCHLPWTVIAAIGRTESSHASGGRVDAAGVTLGRILGPRLDGSPGTAAIADTDRGVLDGDAVWDRAVGPMQFIPGTWRAYRADGNGDGAADPHNVNDAAAATAAYLCSGGGDLADPNALVAAIFRYNHSNSYVRTIIAWAQAYATGVRPTESLPGVIPPASDLLGTPAPPAEPLPPAAAAAAVALLPRVEATCPVVPCVTDPVLPTETTVPVPTETTVPVETTVPTTTAAPPTTVPSTTVPPTTVETTTVTPTVPPTTVLTTSVPTTTVAPTTDPTTSVQPDPTTLTPTLTPTPTAPPV